MSFISKKEVINDIYISNCIHASTQGKTGVTWYLNRRLSKNTRSAAEVVSKSL